MEPRKSIWYWDKQDREKASTEFLTRGSLYTKDDVERIVRYIEECGGTVRGEVAKTSLRHTLEWNSRQWLKPRSSDTKREAIRTVKSFRRAIRNGELLYKTLGTVRAPRHAAAVEMDLESVGLSTYALLGFRNGRIRELLMLYLYFLREHERRLSWKIDHNEIPEPIRNTNWISKKPETRRREWLESLALRWEASGLSVDSSQAFTGFVRECLPNEERRKEHFLERPRPFEERTVIDWVAKVRQPRERKL